MIEWAKRTYLKEEEFLEDFGDCARAAAEKLDGKWVPNPHCDDSTRRNRDHFLKNGELRDLVFDSATVYDDPSGFTSCQILLRSAGGTLNVRVRQDQGKLTADKIRDTRE